MGSECVSEGGRVRKEMWLRSNAGTRNVGDAFLRCKFL